MLNYTPNQQKAINTLDKNLQIIACAGSGKTQVISQRVVNLLKEKGAAPTNITAFTYTEKAAAELKSRILKLVKEQIGEVYGMAEMYIGTIHAWCLKILQEHIYEFQKYSVLDEVKLKLYVDRHFNRIGMKDLDMDKYKDTGHFIGLMGIVRESELEHEQELPIRLQTALDNYEETLAKGAYFDFTAIMVKAVHHLRNDERFQNKIRSNLKYLICDEYQDVNPIQEAIIREIYTQGANICVVGDDDQTIFQWRGSDVNYIVNFRDRYDNVEYIKLEDNFRSTKGIVDIAQTTITNNTLRLDKVMTAAGSQTYERGDALYNSFANVEEETAFIVKSIQNLRGKAFEDKGLKRGLDYADFAVLLRKWKKAPAIVDALVKAQIPFIVSGVNELFSREEVRAALAIFQYQDKKIDRTVLEFHWQALVPSLSKEKIGEAIEYLDEKTPDGYTFYGSYALQEVFLEFLGKLGVTEESFASDNASHSPNTSIAEVVFYNLGMFSQVINDFETINFASKPTFKLQSFLNFVQYIAQGYYPEGWMNNTYQTPNAVQIMTIYQAKGLEFPLVFIPGLNKNYLPTQKMGGKSVWHYLDKSLIKGQQRYEGGVEDERRLLYVGITRSQKYLFLSRAPDSRNEQNESMFCAEFSRSDYIFSNKLRDYKDRPSLPPQSKTGGGDILLNFSILKNYFDCKYRFKLLTMYGFNPPLSIRMGYGKSIHDVLMEIHKHTLEGGIISKGDIPALLDTHLHFPYAVDAVKLDMRKKASEAVSQYLDLNQEGFKDILFAEKDIQLDLGEGITVNGRMDLIKKKQLDGSYQTTIIDFKSAIDAQTNDVSMEQLALYALGYKDLTGETADFMEVYNLDGNRPFRQEIMPDQLEHTRANIVGAAHDIRENNLTKIANPQTCLTCRMLTVCTGGGC